MSEYLIYQSEDGEAMDTTSEQNKHIFEDGELMPEATVRGYSEQFKRGRALIAKSHLT